MKQVKTVQYKAIFYSREYYDMASTVDESSEHFPEFFGVQFNYFVLYKISVKTVSFLRDVIKKCEILYIFALKNNTLVEWNISANYIKYSSSIIFTCFSLKYEHFIHK